MKSAGPFWKTLNGIVVLGLAFSSIGNPVHKAAAVAANVSPSSQVSALPASASPGRCALRLASEQILFCSPTDLPVNIVEDSTTDVHVNYAGLNQLEGYGIVNIRATSPGYATGPAEPVYHPGRLAEYRQALEARGSSLPGSLFTDGPVALLWGEKVTGLQLEYTFSTSSGDIKYRSIEWNLEHNGRLWSFIITWDTAIQNAAAWAQAAQNFSVQTPAGEKLPDTALDLGAVSADSGEIQSIHPAGGPVDMGLPSWWNGMCDDNNYFVKSPGIHSIALGLPWHGVYACGTDPMSAMRDVRVNFGGGSALEFECVELVLRFLYLQWAIPPWYGNANQLKDYYDPAKVDFYPNDGTPSHHPR